VLHRVVPAKADVKRGAALASLASKLRHPRHATLDGIEIEYVKFASPPRGLSYGSWGRYAARALERALERSDHDLVHAHYAVPAGDAVRRAGLTAPLVVSNHGGDTYFTAQRSANVAKTYAAAHLVLANSAGIAEASKRAGARTVRVVHLGTDLPPEVLPHESTVVTVGHVVARKRHEDVIRALPDCVRYEVVGDGPERARLQRLAHELGKDVVWHGQLPHDEALRIARRAGAFVMPSTDEAFGVAYVEAMAGAVPAIGRRGEPGPEEIASVGGGMLLTDGSDLRDQIERALSDDGLRAQARETVARHFTWDRTGRATVEAYEEALR
jgi:glycosyltransferase involved in cell wall biosynthesis